MYQPRSYNQVISEEPALVLNLPITRPNLEGHIDPQCPHSINYITVDFLGNEEIVALGCDDGDVLFYYTRRIQSEIDVRQENSSSRGKEKSLCELRADFLQNVGDSAWGIAVHRKARMIAFSANTSQVSVFRFALSQQGSSDDDVFEEAYAIFLYFFTVFGN